MPRYQIVVGCDESPVRHFEDGTGGFYRSREPIDIHTTDLDILKYVLLTHIGNFERKYECPQSGGYIRTKEDLPHQKIRSGTIMVKYRNDSEIYLPDVKVCSSCSWKCSGGTVFDDGQFFCCNELCSQKALELQNSRNKEAIMLHQTQGLCIFNQAWIGLCSRQALVDHSFCSDHIAIKCHCGAQATRECSNAGSFVCGTPLCDECSCPQHS